MSFKGETAKIDLIDWGCFWRDLVKDYRKAASEEGMYIAEPHSGAAQLISSWFSDPIARLIVEPACRKLEHRLATGQPTGVHLEHRGYETLLGPQDAMMRHIGRNRWKVMKPGCESHDLNFDTLGHDVLIERNTLSNVLYEVVNDMYNLKQNPQEWEKRKLYGVSFSIAEDFMSKVQEKVVTAQSYPYSELPPDLDVVHGRKLEERREALKRKLHEVQRELRQVESQLADHGHNSNNSEDTAEQKDTRAPLEKDEGVPISPDAPTTGARTWRRRKNSGVRPVVVFKRLQRAPR